MFGKNENFIIIIILLYRYSVESSSIQRANQSREKEREKKISIDRFENDNDSLMKKLKSRNSENDFKHRSENEKELQNIEVLFYLLTNEWLTGDIFKKELQKRLAYLKSKRIEFEQKKFPNVKLHSFFNLKNRILKSKTSTSQSREDSTNRKEENSFASQGAFGQKTMLYNNVMVSNLRS